MARVAALSLAILPATALACRQRAESKLEIVSASPSVSAVIGPPAQSPPPRRGMVWIPPGALVAGTPPESLPRVADEEIPGEQVIMKGYYIDVFPFPNEEGAIPLTNVNREQAQAHCAEHRKRLCTELEWERACKGPRNLPYEYGNRYDANRCNTGSHPRLQPSGIHHGCVSEFGVHDLHGSVWEWTASPWGRGGDSELVTVRGGNSTSGEVVGRCANGAARRPERATSVVGFRCCAGPVNDASVTLTIVRGNKLDARSVLDRTLAARLHPALADLARGDLANPSDFRFDRMWTWRPIGNEELVVLGGCAGIGREPSCGIVVARVHLDRPKALAWASSGHWVPIVHVDVDPRDLWLFGGDNLGSFRSLVSYAWGHVTVGTRERRVPRPPKREREGKAKKGRQ
ncbi:MAG: formylglycine-generating enzyme family protein [Polyangiaceae bacterium]|nr:formylglycine-generating enzyme family protein [Polyangiaceae bacterium]